jgi:aminoglycoside/choline kinase family phosphotransferase
MPTTAVVKAPVSDRTAVFNEWATLRWLTRSGRFPAAPRLLAADPDVPLLVIEDVGAGPSLARLLQVPGAARSAVLEERRLTARLHIDTQGRAHELDAVRGELPDGPAPSAISTSAATIVAELHRWDTPVTSALVAEVDRLTPRLRSPSDTTSLVFHDACPVNRIATARGIRAIDFEHAMFAHPALDAAYPAIGHLACTTRTRPGEQIAWPLPARLAAELAYLDVARPARPSWDADGFVPDLAAATLAWLATILGRARERTVPDDRRGPSRTIARRRVVSALDAVLAVADRTAELASTARWCTEVLDRCRSRWPGTTPLPEVAGLTAIGV